MKKAPFQKNWRKDIGGENVKLELLLDVENYLRGLYSLGEEGLVVEDVMRGDIIDVFPYGCRIYYYITIHHLISPHIPEGRSE